MTVKRATWTDLSDAQLLAQCAVDTYRASGPGGQKRNKTSSAVRLRHPPSGLLVIAEESRSQHENRARALRRLRQALYLKWRDELAPETLANAATRPEYAAARAGDGRLHLGRKDPRFWAVVGLVLDVMQAVGARVSEAAQALEISTGNLTFAFADGRAPVRECASEYRSVVGGPDAFCPSQTPPTSAGTTL